ncbi:MAG: hypothetical protein OEZ06_08770 [Myxococcales bacterium]|nr:hypothetical protein [Myxococcales bacterium]
MAAGELEPRYRHALLIGTTGMLAAASAWIAGRTERVTVVARRASEFRLGDPVLDGRLERIAADYADTDAFIAGLEVRLSAAAGLDLCVTWIRPAAHDLRDRIAVRLHASRARAVPVPSATPRSPRARFRHCAAAAPAISSVIRPARAEPRQKLPGTFLRAERDG